ncbi:helix-turn-helix domain-containing protein [Flavobacterium glaciei]|uniref:AraC-like DNA-binding protein n=1 Tax=Flavobacterium glaciei TaxID=386300 RepID=A0A562PQL5_9FLAO|nr:helix-turn-helix domain-containing protein [Flavobacterium glaciei]RDI53569.1 AraC-like DNA-binding protein [Flavobacterium glaciei]TWI46470.1 AraC-like DNA-binding protein [Flavobacterium glaciei]
MIYLQPIKTVFLVLFPLFLWSQSPITKHSSLSYDSIDNNYFKEEGNYQKQLAWANVYIKKAQKDKKSIRKARGYYLLAILYYTDQPLKAIQYLDSVIKYSKIEPNKFFPAAAYCEKADLLVKQRKFDQALRNFNLAEQAALKTNIDYYYVVRNAIGTTKSEELGEVSEALKLYQECFNYYRSKDYRGDYYSGDYQNIIFGLADCYKALKKSDSTTFYNTLGYKEASITKNKEYQLLFTLNEGANQVDKRNYSVALDSINKALPDLIKIKNTGNVLASYYYSGKAHVGLGNKSKAVQNFIKVDSIYKIRKRITPEFVSGYSYLIDYYKKTGDKEKQLQYITKFMSIDSVLQRNYKHLNKVLLKEYDTPHLFAEKENLIQSLKKKQTTSYVGILVLVLLVIAIGSFGYYQYYLKKQYRKRFYAILRPAPIESINNPKNDDIKIIAKEIIAEEQSRIPSEIVKQLLEKLALFEKEDAFLEKTITIQKTAVKLNTNTKYLSKVINENKGKTFVSYINDLRVEYAITQLQVQPKLRNFTMQALANEFGFNSAESFSSAFYKKHKIKPTYFIKELENLK